MLLVRQVIFFFSLYSYSHASNLLHCLFFFLPNIHIFVQALIEVPYVLLQVLVYGIMVYAMVGYEWTVTKVFWYIFFIFFTTLYFTYYGMMSVAMTPNQNTATLLTRPSYVLWNLFSGFVVPPPVKCSGFLLMMIANFFTF